MYVIGVDIGTTGTKAMLVNESGTIVANSYKGYPLIMSGKDRIEQRAEDWWEAFILTVKECTKDIQDKHNIIALSISSQGASMVPVDKNGVPLTNVMTWMDHRGLKQQEALLKIHNDEFYYLKTGWRLATGLNLVKIKWLKDNEPDIFQKTSKFLTTIDYINFKLTGNFVIDPSNGAMTQLMDIHAREWDDEILNIIGINTGKLPEIISSGVEIGNLTEDTAFFLGLNTSVQVVNGGHDQYCAAVGSGAISSGDILLSTGTAWAVLGINDKPVFDTASFVSPGPHIVQNMWGALATIRTAGIAMEWFRDNFALRLQNDMESDPESFKNIDRNASELMERIKGLMFYPHFIGSGFPRWNEKSKASILGLDLEHGRYDVARAIMEGMAFEVRYILKQYKKQGLQVHNLRILGGASRSELWMDIIANVVNCSIIRFKEVDVACIGAAIIAGVGCGMFSGYAQGYEKISKAEDFSNLNTDKIDFYQEKYEKYKIGIRHLEEYYNETN